MGTKPSPEHRSKTSVEGEKVDEIHINTSDHDGHGAAGAGDGYGDGDDHDTQAVENPGIRASMNGVPRDQAVIHPKHQVGTHPMQSADCSIRGEDAYETSAPATGTNRNTSTKNQHQHQKEEDEEEEGLAEDGFASSTASTTSSQKAGGYVSKCSVLQQKWNQMYERLFIFKQEHGHCLVPNRYVKHHALGAWVSTQRRQVRACISAVLIFEPNQWTEWYILTKCSPFSSHTHHDMNNLPVQDSNFGGVGINTHDYRKGVKIGRSR
jgi:hypothetical protein